MPNTENAGTRRAAGSAPNPFAIIPRVLLITFGLTGIAFAVSLLLGIVGMAAFGISRGHLPDMRLAYRHVALPVAVVAGAVAFLIALVAEIRHYLEGKMLNKMNLERVR